MKVRVEVKFHYEVERKNNVRCGTLRGLVEDDIDTLLPCNTDLSIQAYRSNMKGPPISLSVITLQGSGLYPTHFACKCTEIDADDASHDLKM